MIASKYFFERKDGGSGRLRRSLQSHRPTLLFLDYDGTLVPIQKKPSLAVLSTEVRSLIRRVAQRPDIAVGVVTGRSLADIKKMVRLPSIFYIANHGFQISLNQTTWIHPDAKQILPFLADILSTLRSTLKSTRGAIIEDKLFTLSVHHRNVESRSLPHLKKTVGRVVHHYRGMFRITTGKKVIEVRPNLLWNKGRAVLTVLKMLAFRDKPLIVYIGDDKTDEDAFKALHAKAMTIRVERSRTSRAKYFVRNPSEVHRLLKEIASINTAGK